MDSIKSALVLSFIFTIFLILLPLLTSVEEEPRALIDCGRAIERASFAIERDLSISELQTGIECLKAINYDPETFQYKNLSSILLLLEKTDSLANNQIDYSVRLSLEKTGKSIVNKAFGQRFIVILVSYPMNFAFFLLFKSLSEEIRIRLRSRTLW